MKISLFILCMFLFICPTFSQQDCEVLTASLVGKYTGDCKNKKAEGQGKAEGIDSYEGNFKNGYPSGEGTYTYKNGDTFKGVFKKGIKEGRGVFSYKKEGSPDSIISGFWKNDVYVGAYLHPYVIEEKSPRITRLDVRQDVGIPNTLTITSENIIKGNDLRNNAPPPLPVINSYRVDQGSYGREERSSTGKIATLILYNLKFPFHIHVSFGQESFDLLISKEGTWNVLSEITVQN